jgi:hypothetical protein
LLCGSSEDALASGFAKSLLRVSSLKLLVDLLDVSGVDRVRADAELIGNLLVDKPCFDTLQDLLSPCAEKALLLRCIGLKLPE